MSLKQQWYKSLIAIPEWLKSTDGFLDSNYTTMCEDFTGKVSQFKYECDETTSEYVFHINMTISQAEAIKLQQMYSSTDVLGFKIMSYEQALDRFIQDGFFSENL